ncbi:MAG: TldD/PmbA family protein [Candidatus Muirbacterium halophilum]|nr:TldD/PmbA family protein [Candidatus Muirbacterium halophilum]MCK9474300.1 TldD/PmbA family protein [Candidatus Muirbacterium halophilum]
MFIFPQDLYCDVRIERKFSTSISFLKEKLENFVERATEGAFIRIFDGNMWYYSATTSILDIQKEIDSLSHLCSSNSFILENSTVKKFQVNKEKVDKFIDNDVRKISSDKKMNLVKCYINLFSLRPYIKMWNAHYEENHTTMEFYSSSGSDLTWTNQSCGLRYSFNLAENDKKFNDSYSFGANCFTELENLEGEISKYIDEAYDFMKNAKDIKPGKYCVILSPLAAGIFAHESFGHKSESDFMIGDEKMKKEWAIGKKVGSSILSIVDDGQEMGVGYTPYDDEGSFSEKTYLIKDGILSGRLHSVLTASKLEENPTGNARAISFMYEPIVRMTTTYIDKGDKTKEQLFSEVKEGIFIDTIKHGSGLSTFTLAPSRAYYMKDGKIEYPVNVAVITGTVFETLNRIDGLSDKVKLLSFVGGGCGKMEQAPLPVGFGGPFVRVSQMDVM